MPSGKCATRLSRKASGGQLCSTSTDLSVAVYSLIVIERKPESNRQLYSRLAGQLRRNFTTQFNISINESDFKLFINQAFDVVTIGNKPDWSIFYGLSFAMTSLTTVGKLG